MNDATSDFITLVDGGQVEVLLQDAITFGNEEYTKIYLRQLKAGDILDAQEAAERLVYAKDGSMALVMSPVRMSREVLRRQVSRLENAHAHKYDGPLSSEELGRFSSFDLMRLQTAVGLLDLSSALAVEGVQARGRTAAGSENNASAAGAFVPQGGD